MFPQAKELRGVPRDSTERRNLIDFPGHDLSSSQVHSLLDEDQPLEEEVDVCPLPLLFSERKGTVHSPPLSTRTHKPKQEAQRQQFNPPYGTTIINEYYEGMKKTMLPLVIIFQTVRDEYEVAVSEGERLPFGTIDAMISEIQTVRSALKSQLMQYYSTFSLAKDDEMSVLNDVASPLLRWQAVLNALKDNLTNLKRHYDPKKDALSRKFGCSRCCFLLSLPPFFHFRVACPLFHSHSRTNAELFKQATHPEFEHPRHGQDPEEEEEEEEDEEEIMLSGGEEDMDEDMLNGQEKEKEKEYEGGGDLRL